MTYASAHRRSGKHVFDDIYDRPDPRAYWQALAPLDYRIPQYAHGVFSALVDDRRRRAGDGKTVTVTDLCCSYGVNAALLKHTCTVDDLNDRYCSKELEGLTSDELVAADAGFFGERRRPDAPRVIGVDTAASAVRYGLRTGLLDAGCTQNLEERDPSPETEQALAATDLVTVTGGVGYIGERTFDRVLSCIPVERDPWVAAFALRWVDYEPIAAALAHHGLVTEQLTAHTFPQRRFASEEEREYVLDTLADMGIDPQGRETEGGYHACLYLSRPKHDVVAAPLDDWFAGSVHVGVAPVAGRHERLLDRAR